MKRLKEGLFLSITVLMFILLNFHPLQASALPQKSAVPFSDEIHNIVDTYFSYRENNIINDNYSRKNAQELSVSADESILNFEAERSSRYRDIENRLEIEITQAKVKTYFEELNVEDNLATFNLYEWITMDYKSLINDKLDYMGMGIWHTINLERKKDHWEIIKVSYDEGPLTGVHTSDKEHMMGAYYNYIPIEQPDFVSSNVLNPNDIYPHPSTVNDENTSDIQYNPNYKPYNRNGVVAYADTWVSDEAWGENYEQYYNPAYKNFNSQGGDCANYVSQAMHEGGTLPMIGKYNHSNASGAWWYDNMGTSTTADDLVTENWSWTGAHYHRQHIAISYGTATIDNPTNAQITTGNPVYYDWTGNGWYNHVTIAVGVNAAGQKIVNSHNNDYYRVHWNYGSSSTKYSMVRIVNEYFSPPID